MNRIFRRAAILIAAIFTLVLGAWSLNAAPITEHKYDYSTQHSIRDIMASMAELPAEALWDPSNGEWGDDGLPAIPDDEFTWNRLRYNAIILGEVSNAINLPGRAVDNVLPGEELEGVLSPQEIEDKIKNNYAQWVGFSKALEDLSNQFVEAIDARDTQRIVDLGTTMNDLCTACHVVFWYPPEAQ